MRRRVIGYDKTLEYLQKGYGVTVSPMGGGVYIYDKDKDEFVTVRREVITKLLQNNLVRYKLVGWSRFYYLKEVR